MPTDTLHVIIAALTYYDAFDAPLTSQEIFLSQPLSGAQRSLEDVERALFEARRSGYVGFTRGFYHLPGREAVVPLRASRYLLAERKYRKVLRFLRIARFAPFLRAVFVCNTLARSQARSESDSDLFLVAAPGRIWFSRLCVTGLAMLLGVRPTMRESSDRICLSFFVTERALDLTPLAICDDVYLAHWLHELYPVYDESTIARRSHEANAWARASLPAALTPAASARRSIMVRAVGVKKLIERTLDAISGNRFERWAKRLQLAWMPMALKAAAKAGSAVVLTDDILKFHDHDRRIEIRDRYHASLRNLPMPVAELSDSVPAVSSGIPLVPAGMSA